MSSDVDSYQLHMVIAKPVSRVTIWLGKWFGVCFVNGVLLLLAAVAIYVTVTHKFSRQAFSNAEKTRIRTEVLTGRKVFYPELPDFEKIARQELPARKKELNAKGIAPDESTLLERLREEKILQYCEIPYNDRRVWIFKDLPVNDSEKLFVRYRFYVNKVSSEKQRMTYGLWYAGIPVSFNQVQARRFEREQAHGKATFYLRSLEQEPRQYMTGVFHEFSLDGRVVSPSGEAQIAYANLDGLKSPVYTQLSDGPKILVKTASFFENYWRGIIIMFLQLVIMGGLGCAAASFLSMPTAVFMVISYLLFGSMASFMTAQEYVSGTLDSIGHCISRMLLFIIIPVQNFEVTQFLANGELIEVSFMGRIFFSYFMLRALPFILLGAWLYNRRQMGLAIRK